MQHNEKYVDISVCKSNIKRNGSYFGRVCKRGKIGKKELMQELKKRAPYIDIDMMQTGLEKIVEIIFDMATNGVDVDFFSLGTFSLATPGKLEVKKSIENSQEAKEKPAILPKETCKNMRKKAHLEERNVPLSKPCNMVSECKDYDVSSSIVKNVQFALKFAPSKIVKEKLKNVKMNVAIKKNRAPVIDEVEFVHTQNTPNSPIFIKIKGDGLKLSGEMAEVGLYIEEKEAMENIKICKSSILQNEPKNLLVMLDGRLKPGAQCKIKLITQYRSGGKTKILRMGEHNFVYNMRY